MLPDRVPFRDVGQADAVGQDRGDKGLVGQAIAEAQHHLRAFTMVKHKSPSTDQANQKGEGCMSKFFYVHDAGGTTRLLNSDRVSYLLANNGDWEKGAKLKLLPGGSGQPESITLSPEVLKQSVAGLRGYNCVWRFCGRCSSE